MGVRVCVYTLLFHDLLDSTGHVFRFFFTELRSISFFFQIVDLIMNIYVLIYLQHKLEQYQMCLGKCQAPESQIGFKLKDLF